MMKLWRHVIQPIFEAANVKNVLEIGAEAGTSTSTLLKYVIKTNGFLYSIDPYPDFDSDAMQRANSNHLIFHKDLSLNVLPGHPLVDAVLVDGDHNWYTVFRELKEIEALHGSDTNRQPIVFVHDTSWPYARRDLYYNPATIPQQHRHPHEQKGMLPNRSELATDGGMNRNLWNATHEGGKHNGVLTAVEDYLAQTEIEFHFINLPLCFGLGILITKHLLNSNDNLKAVLKTLASYKGAIKLMGFTEHLRCINAILAQAVELKLCEAESRIAHLENLLENAGKATSAGDRESLP